MFVGNVHAAEGFLSNVHTAMLVNSVHTVMVVNSIQSVVYLITCSTCFSAQLFVSRQVFVQIRISALINAGQFACEYSASQLYNCQSVRQLWREHKSCHCRLSQGMQLLHYNGWPALNA